MEVITKVACGSVIAGGGGAAGAYGVHRISVAYEKNEEDEKASKDGKSEDPGNPESSAGQNTVSPESTQNPSVPTPNPEEGAENRG